MKVYVKSTSEITVAKRYADSAAKAIDDFQESVTGAPELSDNLSNEDIEILDKARSILTNFAEG